MTTARALLWVATGLAWAAPSVLGLPGPSFSDVPAAPDPRAVVAFGVAFALTAPAVLAVTALVPPNRDLRVVAAVVAVGSVAAAAGRVLDETWGIEAVRQVHVLGSLASWVGMILLALVLDRAKRRDLALVPLLHFIGFSFLPVGGGLLTLVGWAGLALWTLRDGSPTGSAGMLQD